MGTWMIHFLFPELKSQHLREDEASAPTPSPPTQSLPSEAQSLSTLTLAVGAQVRVCKVWPGVRSPSDTNFEGASCDTELGTLRAGAQETPSSAQRKRVPGVFLA